MTPDERLLLSNFLRDLTQARGGPKDPEADSMIGQALSSSPDAAYVLVQHAVLADQALHAAQARIADLESQMRGQGQGSSFLGGGAPAPGPNAWNQGPSTSVPPSYPPQPAYAQPAYAQPAYAPPQPQPGIFSGGGELGSFLRSAGTMAAGVAGGELLFGGLSNMFGGGRGFGGGGGGMWGGGPTVENVTINEYNDDGGAYGQGGDFGGGSDWSDDGN